MKEYLHIDSSVFHSKGAHLIFNEFRNFIDYFREVNGQRNKGQLSFRKRSTEW